MWGIEQNEGWETYLSQYWAVDNVDHMISIASVQYICWKQYLHTLAIAVVAAYDMYLEYCEGGLDLEWHIAAKNRMSFRGFRLLLSEQMLRYSLINVRFPGNKCFQA